MVIFLFFFQALYAGEKKPGPEYWDYLGISIVGATLSVVPIGFTYYTLFDGDEGNEKSSPNFRNAHRVMAISFSLGSSVAVTIQGKNKWKIFLTTIGIQAVGVALSFNVKDYYILFYDLMIPAISAGIAYSIDHIKKDEPPEIDNKRLIPKLIVTPAVKMMLSVQFVL